jgi:hypothetical protein
MIYLQGSSETRMFSIVMLLSDALVRYNVCLACLYTHKAHYFFSERIARCNFTSAAAAFSVTTTICLCRKTL